MPVLTATEKDIPAMVALLNSAYRGEASKKGWTTEADLVAGDIRTDEPAMKDLMQNPDARFLKFENDQNEIEGCVYVHKKANKLYFGMFAVSPLQQAKGIGRQLMNATEEYARNNNCEAVFMRVIAGRDELIQWYERLGYQKTGITEPFPENDRFGIATRPLEFILMEKKT